MQNIMRNKITTKQIINTIKYSIDYLTLHHIEFTFFIKDDFYKKSKLGYFSKTDEKINFNIYQQQETEVSSQIITKILIGNFNLYEDDDIKFEKLLLDLSKNKLKRLYLLINKCNNLNTFRINSLFKFLSKELHFRFSNIYGFYGDVFYFETVTPYNHKTKTIHKLNMQKKENLKSINDMLQKIEKLKLDNISINSSLKEIKNKKEN